MPERDVQIDLSLEEERRASRRCAPAGDSYAWTRKQGGVRASGTVVIAGRRHVDFRLGAVIDDTAAYYERHTAWHWSAGVGIARDGRSVAWNLVDGVNDSALGTASGRCGSTVSRREAADRAGSPPT